jgi:hypothetical protein
MGRVSLPKCGWRGFVICTGLTKTTSRKHAPPRPVATPPQRGGKLTKREVTFETEYQHPSLLGRGSPKDGEGILSSKFTSGNITELSRI